MKMALYYSDQREKEKSSDSQKRPIIEYVIQKSKNQTTKEQTPLIFKDTFEKAFMGNDDAKAPSGWKYITIIRDPVDRFISRFLKECIMNQGNCYGCGANMTCFLEFQRKFLIKFQENMNVENVDRSFLPQTWQCDFNKHFERIFYSSKIITAEDSAKRLIELFKSQNVSRNVIRNIEERFRLKENQEEFQIKEFLEKRFYSNGYLIELLVSCYYWDFILLDFPFPELRYSS
ncbi:hypothetical protein FO519_003597 [Halicephalobus sp. NKZ332]|nr:hypothetical protein FO519_003597 [Halicephalobus sp. NKZ332]